MQRRQFFYALSGIAAICAKLSFAGSSPTSDKVNVMQFGNAGHCWRPHGSAADWCDAVVEFRAVEQRYCVAI